MTGETLVVVSILALAWSVTFVVQLDSALARHLRRADVLVLFPVWRFFAPLPVVFDFQLLVRDRRPDGGSSDWQELSLERRGDCAVIWNPHRRMAKALYTEVTALVRSLGRETPRQVVASAPYRSVLRYVLASAHLPAARATQFMILRSTGFVSQEPSRQLLVSQWHPL